MFGIALFFSVTVTVALCCLAIFLPGNIGRYDGNAGHWIAIVALLVIVEVLCIGYLTDRSQWVGAKTAVEEAE